MIDWVHGGGYREAVGGGDGGSCAVAGPLLDTGAMDMLEALFRCRKAQSNWVDFSPVPSILLGRRIDGACCWE